MPLRLVRFGLSGELDQCCWMWSTQKMAALSCVDVLYGGCIATEWKVCDGNSKDHMTKLANKNEIHMILNCWVRVCFNFIKKCSPQKERETASNEQSKQITCHPQGLLLIRHYLCSLYLIAYINETGQGELFWCDFTVTRPHYRSLLSLKMK